MSRYNVQYEMGVYETDFGVQYEHLKIKIQFGAPGIETIYQLRTAGGCSPKTYFKPRHIIATFVDGRKLIYPVAFETSVRTTALILKNLGAVCMDYVGEKWSLIFGAAIGGGNLSYKTTNYSALAPSKSYETGSFDYTSDLGLQGLSTVQLPYKVPSNDVSDLVNCQKRGLNNSQESKGICVAQGLIIPRMLIIKANSLDGDGHIGKVIRQAKVSERASVATIAVEIAGCASCLGYEGESINGLESLL